MGRPLAPVHTHPERPEGRLPVVGMEPLEKPLRLLPGKPRRLFPPAPLPGGGHDLDCFEQMIRIHHAPSAWRQ
jgi:hypothetical protein